MNNHKVVIKIFLLQFVVLLLVGLNGQAQIVIDQSDMPSAGDTVRISTALNFDQYDFEETGENFTWDFSSLLSLNQRVDTFVAVTDTPIFYWPFFMFSANLASPIISDSPFPEIPLTDVYNFYNNSSNAYEDLGFAATLFSLPLPFKFNSPDVVYNFPVNYGNVDSSQSGFNIGLDGIGYVMIDRKRVNYVDGWGTLKTPYGTFDVLRLKSEVNEYDSIYIDSVSLGVPIERNFIEYKWLAKGQKVPLLKVSTNLLGLVVEYVDSLSVETTGIANQFKNEESVHVFPNPVSDILNIEFKNNIKGEFEIALYDLQGNLVLKQKSILINSQVVQIDIKDLVSTPGTYVINLFSDEFAITKKIIYQP